MPIYLMTCIGCGVEREILCSEYLAHGSLHNAYDQRCECGSPTYRKSGVAQSANSSTLWAKQCRTGWLDCKEAKQAISGKGIDV